MRSTGMGCVVHAERFEVGFGKGRQAIPAMLKVRPRNVKEEHLGTELRGSVDEAGVRAPALRAGYVGDLFFHRSGLHGCGEVVVVILEITEFGAELAGAEVAVMVDDECGLSGGAGHRPGFVGVMILFVQVKVKLYVAEIVSASKGTSG